MRLEHVLRDASAGVRAGKAFLKEERSIGEQMRMGSRYTSNAAVLKAGSQNRQQGPWELCRNAYSLGAPVDLLNRKLCGVWREGAVICVLKQALQAMLMQAEVWEGLF